MDDVVGGTRLPVGENGGLDVSAEGKDVSSVFGRPYRSESGAVVIPVARVVEVRRSDGSSATTASPRAVIEVDEKGARIKELTNSTLLGLAGITLVAWNVFWITKTVRAFVKRR